MATKTIYGFELKEGKEVVAVQDFQDWDNTNKKYNTIPGITLFSKDSNGLYQRSLGTVVDPETKKPTNQSFHFTSREIEIPDPVKEEK